MFNYDLNKADTIVDETIDIISELAEKHNENKELFDELMLAKEKLEDVHESLDSADDDLEELKTYKSDKEEEDLKGLTDYDTHNTGFGDVHIKCENENDHQLFMALLDCLKQPTCNRNALHDHLNQLPGLMAGFHS